MQIIFRSDSSTQIGTGHVMRCLTLADELRNHRADITFICREHKGNLCDFIEEKGFTVYRLPVPSGEQGKATWNNHAHWLGVHWEQDARETSEVIKKLGHDIDWLIVDHYALDRNWEEKLRPLVDKIMVIDDLADRPHDCDVLLDQNLYTNMESRYENLVPENCQTFLGPGYALLRPEFREARKKLRQRDGTVQRIFVFFGGSDPKNETAKALKAIQSLKRSDIAVDVVVGSTNPHREEVRRLCATMENVFYHCNVDNMAELMAKADLAIGASGATSWERCCLGLPALIVSLADNQVAIAKALDFHKACVYVGTSEVTSVNVIRKAIIDLLSNQNKFASLLAKSYSLVDGLGVSNVYQAMRK